MTIRRRELLKFASAAALFGGLPRSGRAADNAGVKLGDAPAATLEALPGTGKHELNAPVAGYIEAHIEQGPLLEMQGKTIGVVTGIQGLRWFNVEVFGESAHAGTTPLAVRKDAVRSAVATINALAELTRDPQDVVSKLQS